MNVFVARQPIFDKQKKVYTYKLFFRSGFDNFYNGWNDDHATASTLHTSFFSIGLENLTQGKKALINFTSNLLLQEVPLIFPSESLAVEIPEDIHTEDRVVAACRKLRQAGYTLFMDHSGSQANASSLLELADVVKVDFTRATSEVRCAAIQNAASENAKFLACKVETQELFKEAVDLGYSYFQGHFFSKPEVVKGREVPGYKIAYLKLLDEISQPDLDYSDLEKIFKHDVSLSYKLLQIINSAAFGIPNEIRSIRHALTMLGLREVKKWLSVVALSGVGKDKSEELILNSLIRANLCELVAPQVGMADRAPELFLTGLFSMVDAFLDQSLDYFLERMPISADIKQALLGGESPFGEIYQLVLAYERADWNKLTELSVNIGFRETEFPELYFKAVQKSNHFLLC